jgi:hypothetical protein
MITQTLAEVQALLQQLGATVWRLRLEHGWSQDVLSDRSGLHRINKVWKLACRACGREVKDLWQSPVHFKAGRLRARIKLLPLTGTLPNELERQG